MALFYPTIYRRRITDITVKDLDRLAVCAVLLDVDNTLTTHDNPCVADDVKLWLQNMQASGIHLIIVSNNSEERVAPFAQSIGLPYIARGRKPLPSGYLAAGRYLQVPLSSCVAIGDQIFTDILGANLCGIPSILLEPIEAEVDQKFIVFKRKIERWLLMNQCQMRRKESDYD